MAFSSLVMNSLKQIAVNPTKNVIFSNQFRCSSFVGNSALFKKNKTSSIQTKISELPAVMQLSTSPVSRSEHGDHSKIWTAERALAAGLLGVLPAGLLMPCQPLDTLMALSIVMHMHWGIEAIVIDYVRPIIFGPVIPKIGVMLVYALSIATLAGLLNFIFNDVGLGNGISLLWKL